MNQSMYTIRTDRMDEFEILWNQIVDVSDGAVRLERKMPTSPCQLTPDDFSRGGTLAVGSAA